MNERRTMLTAFSPPGGLTGTAALLCALSADAPTLELLLSEFTGARKEQRRSRGVATALLALDGRTVRTELRKVAGLYVAEPVLASWPEGSMLHAKVALLGFSREPLEAPELVRLVVSTGNWTAASLSEHVDMLWIGDLDLNAADQDAMRSDVVAAAGLFRDLLHGEDGLFQATPPTNADGLLATCLALGGRGRPRFIHSMVTPLIGQIGRRFVPKAAPWNWIYAGSGFFEQAGEADPTVLKRIDKALEGKVIARPDRWVAVNPGRPGAFASKPSPGWMVCEPIPDEKRAFMHAKFIAAGRRFGENNLDVTVYLGSGNLSKAGLLTALPNGRNSRIEAGVVFNAGSLPEKTIWEVLPNSAPMDAKRLAELVEGPGEPDAPPIPPPPVLYAELVGCGDRPRLLRLRKSVPEVAMQVKVADTLVDVPVGTTEVEARGFDEAYLEVRVEAADPWESVPVLGIDGAFARVKTQPGTVEDLVEALMAYPFPPEPSPVEEGSQERSGAAPPSRGRSGATSSYPARDAMRIVEEVARLAAAAAAGPPDRVAGLARTLRWSLIEGLREEDKATFAALGVDFTAPLEEMPGMPQEDAWREFVADVASDWGLPPGARLSLRSRKAGGGS
jgi:hypothetical protein